MKKFPRSFWPCARDWRSRLWQPPGSPAWWRIPPLPRRTRFFGPFGKEPFFAAERNNTDPVFSVYAHIEIDEK